MTAVAAFRATYTDWKLVRTRSVVQIVFELPVEKADEAYATLGGMPTPGAETWCAIARLNEGENTGQQAHETSPTPRAAEPDSPTPPPAQSRSWHKLLPAQQAGIRCSDKAFIRFLSEEFNSSIMHENAAADFVRFHCLVPSRKDIKPNHPSAKLWRELDEKFQAWMLVAA
jgi:hypothetical protein